MISGDLSMSKRRRICISVALTLGMITFTASAMAQVAAPDHPHPQPQPHHVPEIDAGSVGSALGLLGFGTIMLLEGRRRRLACN
jgi:hypothetical protein